MLKKKKKTTIFNTVMGVWNYSILFYSKTKVCVTMS